MELLAVYDNNGNITNKKIVRGNKNIVLSHNEHVAVAVIFIENRKGEFLIQKTSKEKGSIYSSTGGHILFNETPIDAIKREVYEELGVDISNDDIKELGYLLYDIPIRFIFYLKKDIDLKEIKLQKDEVELVKYISRNKVNELIKEKTFLDSHSRMFKEVQKYIDKV